MAFKGKLILENRKSSFRFPNCDKRIEITLLNTSNYNLVSFCRPVDRCLGVRGSRGGRRGSGPWKITKIGFLSNTGPDP